MVTSYVMKATHINSPPLGIIYWVVTGSADLTGIFSGYDPIDLTSIAIDYTTTTSAANSTGVWSQVAGGDLSGTYPDPIVAKIQGQEINNTAPDDGYLLTYSADDAYWAAKPPPAGSSITSGLASDKPSATGSGALYICDDVPIIYLDDSATLTWKAYNNTGYSGDSPGLIGDYTAVGSIGLKQLGDSILAMAAINTKTHHVLKAIPGGVAAGGPWEVKLVGHCSFTRNTNYPGFGVCVSNGTTINTSNALFSGWYQYSANQLVYGIWLETLNTQTRPAIYFGDNSLTMDAGPYYFRILNDGTNYFYQASILKGAHWRTIFTNTKATVGLTVTHYGFSVGCPNGSGFTAATISGLSMSTIPQLTITNVTYSSSLYTVTVNSDHNLTTGDSVSITDVVGSGTSPNGAYENTVIVTGNTTFTVPGASFTYTSDGLVTLTSR